VLDLMEFSRESGHFHMGLSPRAGLALLNAARARARLYDRSYALPEDVQALLPAVAGHRLRLAGSYQEPSPQRLTALFAEAPSP
jgi:MoxR-like ATPase